MDNRAVALKLILDELDINDISSVERRLEVQKSVYLVQSSGVALGYTYGWYLKGPYSPSLTRDYYNLADETVPAGTTLKPAALQNLDRVRQLMAEAIEDLPRPQRLELLASIHFLMKSSGYSEAQAKERIRETKPHLSSFLSYGIALLKKHNLL